MHPTRPLLAAALLLGLVTPLSAPPAQSATTPVVSKRGVASAKYLKTFPAKLNAAGAGWTYNWTYRVPASTEGLDVVPMIRSAASLSAEAVSTLQQGRENGDYRYLLGFNEPDNHNQAAMSPSHAARLWPALQATGLILGSPAPANVTNGWLRQFMAIAAQHHLRVDFIALHFYANITDPRALARIKLQVEQIRKHYGKPIWITELGIIDRRKHPGPAAVNWGKAQHFMRAVTAMLDAKPYVQRYAWMADNVSKHAHLRWSSMYDAYGRLTPLGAAYNSLH